MQRQSTMIYRDPSSGEGGDEFSGHSIQITLPPKPGYEGDNYDYTNPDEGESKMDVCALSLSSLAQDPNLPSSKLPFAWKLYEMLETVHKNDVDTDIVSWVDDGKAFKVHDLKRFVDEIVPTYFKQSKYKSFQRQLYFYGFTRETSSGKKGHTPGSYRHPKFIRGKKTMCLSMTPKKAKKRDGNKSPVLGASVNKQTPSAEPNVVRKVSGEVNNNDSLQNMGTNANGLSQLMNNMVQANGNNNVQQEILQNNNGDFKPQMQFRNQQNNLQRLQMEGFLRSLHQNDRQTIAAHPQQSNVPQATQLHHSISDGNSCNIFGSNFHIVGRKRSS